MNREIKFRAWDCVINQMFIPSMINQDGDIRHTGVALSESNWRRKGDKFETWLLKSVPNSFALMQFTGLKDIYGKEIFESDIVKHLNGVNVVKWDSYSLSFQMGLSSFVLDQEICRYEDYKIEVIGNIYENPEIETKK